MYRHIATCSEVDDQVEHEDRVRDAVEDDPLDAEVVVEERDGDWKNDEIGDQQHQHDDVPVEPVAMATTRTVLTSLQDGRIDLIKPP